MPEATPCRACGTLIERKPGPGRKPLYCSEACRRGATKRPPLPVLSCVTCGQSCPPQRGGKRRIYCSHPCFLAEHRRRHAGPVPKTTIVCAWCCQVSTGRKRKFCSKRCLQVATAHRKRYGFLDRTPLQPCQTCDSWVPHDPRRRRFCSDGCKVAWEEARQALRRGVMAVELVDRAEVFERDGWKCQLCRKRVDPVLAHPDPLSASLDHVVPIVDGGEHTMANVQLAHLRCNLSKNRRPMPQGEQLRLVG